MTTDDMDEWGLYLRFKYGLSAPIAEVTKEDEEEQLEFPFYVAPDYFLGDNDDASN